MVPKRIEKAYNFMKVMIKKAELLKHKKTLKIAKLSKIIESSGVTLTASERFSVVGQGFKNELDCQSLQWGSVTIPYATWKGCFRFLSKSLQRKLLLKRKMV
jgi:hypothetical protein